MAKNDFDLDFDFEKEYGFDPKAILDSDYSEEDLDLSQFDDEALALGMEGDAEPGYEDFDLDSLGLEDEDSDSDFRADYRRGGKTEPAQEAYSPRQEQYEDSFFEEEADTFSDDEDLTAGIDFSKRASFFGVEDGAAAQPEYEPEYQEQPEFEEPVFAEPAEEAQPDDVSDEETEEPSGSSRRRRGKEKKEKPSFKLTMPSFLTKLIGLYFPSQQQIAERMESAEGRRRRKPSKRQIFKEFYLPTIIAGLAMVLILSFVIGAISNGIDRMQVEREQKELLAQQESIAAEQMANEAQLLLEEAEKLAMGYNYEAAVEVLNGYTGEPTQEMSEKKAEYMNIQSALVYHQDPTLIPNLSFHVLMADPVRSYADAKYGGQYNRNFVSTDEFAKILDQLYRNNYVLVDFDSFVSSNSVDGNAASLFATPILLPAGKKPVMITETMVNYYNYMTDSNGDGMPDGGGAGFASRLVVDDNGDIKAEYVDASNATLVGNYDLVPILEDFIAQHPDFSYRGARATLAISGEEGIFGYRIQSETMAKKGQDYYNQQVVEATKVVEALKEKGYRLACYTFKDIAYHNISAAMILEDIQKWKAQIAPVVGELDTIVFAKASDIGDYTGGKFDVLYDNGFRFMIKNAEAPYTEVNTSFVRQSRLMVTGENMAWKGSMFTDNGLFDPNTILDLALRGNVPH